MGIAFPMTKRENKIWYFVFTDEKNTRVVLNMIMVIFTQFIYLYKYILLSYIPVLGVKIRSSAGLKSVTETK